MIRHSTSKVKVRIILGVLYDSIQLFQGNLVAVIYNSCLSTPLTSYTISIGCQWSTLSSLEI